MDGTVEGHWLHERIVHVDTSEMQCLLTSRRLSEGINMGTAVKKPTRWCTITMSVVPDRPSCTSQTLKQAL